MLGAIIGDIVGSRWEFRRIKTKAFSLFAEDCACTDDSILTCAVADALLNDRHPAEALRDWARRIPIPQGVGGYGQKFMRWVAAPTPQPPYGSLGNGGAMRVSPAAWLSNNLDEALEQATRVTVVTHDHTEGLKAALATTAAIRLALDGRSPGAIRRHIAQAYGYDMDRGVDDIRPNYVRSEQAPNSVPEAILCALEATSFEDALRNAVSLGGDADTQAAIAGPIAEVLYGIPEEIHRQALRYIPQEMQVILDQLYR